MKTELEDLNKQIQKLEDKSKRLIQTTQAECKHPFDKLLDIKRYYGCYRTVRVCSLCYLGESEPFNFSCKVSETYKEVPVVSKSFIKPLFILDGTDKYALEYPMRFFPNSLNKVIGSMGRTLWDRYVNRKSHVAYGGVDYDHEQINSDNLKELSEQYYEFKKYFVTGTYNDSYLEEK